MDLRSILADSLPVITAVDDLEGYRSKVPIELEAINGLAVASDADIARMVSTILENLGLLRSERRLFISYRRIESKAVAIQLYEALDARGFDVFLDTRSVRPAVNFQAELWHRLADTDVVVLLDTPDFRISDWTVQELARANATNVQILHLLWPGVNPDPASAFSDFLPLRLADFRGGIAPDFTAPLTDECVLTVCRRAESLRARALAARYAYLVDSFCDAARNAGHDVIVQPGRYISLGAGGAARAVFPAVGVPSSPRIEEFERAVEKLVPAPPVRFIYVERGVLDKWRTHLAWLSSHLPVKTFQLSDVPDALAAGAL
jgi:hypothetical protein